MEHQDSESSDDEYSLSEATQSALREFLISKANMEAEEERIAEQTQLVSEDWGLSQFWYTEETANKLAKEALLQLGEDSSKRVACVCTPSIFVALKKLGVNFQYYMFEYDRRFAAYGEQFVFYDYNQPLDIPEEFKNSFDLIFVDTPFISEEALTKVSQTVKKLVRSTDTKLVILSGSVMSEWVSKLYWNITLCPFKPQHHKLQNDFLCFTNYQGGTLL